MRYFYNIITCAYYSVEDVKTAEDFAINPNFKELSEMEYVQRVCLYDYTIKKGDSHHARITNRNFA